MLCLISIILLIAAFKLYNSVSADDMSPQQHGQEFEEEHFERDTADEDQLVEKIQAAEQKKTTNQKKFVKQDQYILWDQPQGKSDPNGPGENGVGVKFAPEENAKVEQSYSQYGFNQYISDQISLHRSLSDPRPKQLALIIFQIINTRSLIFVTTYNLMQNFTMLFFTNC